MMRSTVDFLINGQPHRVAGPDALLSLSDYLRQRLRLTGTKVVCSEGDCGACTVLIADLFEDTSGHHRPHAPRYEPVDACILFVFQLDGCHVVTVDALADGDTLHPVQQAMVTCHGSQCGFCTPGFVMSMAGLDERGELADDDATRLGLTGNLCRCTGYLQILDAAKQAAAKPAPKLNERWPVDTLRHALGACDQPVEVKDEHGRVVWLPRTLEQATACLHDHPQAKPVGGATDLGVQIKHGRYGFEQVVYLGRVTGLSDVAVTDGALEVGAGASWAAVLNASEDAMPELASVLRVFGAPQIRNRGTIGGNIVNASPIADSLPLLYVTEATLTLTSRQDQRTVPMTGFVRGYKDIDLRPGELLTRITIPRPRPDQRLRLYKVSKRRDLDISTFTAGLLFTLDGETITEARIAYGGVGPTVLRLPRTEQYLAGRPLGEATMQQAGKTARDEVAPITDVRGSDAYRLQLAETILLKAYHELTAPEAVSP